MSRWRARSARSLVAAVFLVCVVLAAVLWRPAACHARALSLLARFQDEHASGPLSQLGRCGVSEWPARVPHKDARLRARIYAPTCTPSPRGLVLVHGVHHLGVDEPRLRRFAHAIATSGVTVLTPEIAELADYRIHPDAISAIGDSAIELRRWLGSERVGLMGLSFAGGLAIMAAADARFQDHVAFVVSVGGHHDARRVLSFFVSNRIERPDGTWEERKAHDYGPLVFVYSAVERFFPEEDVPLAREVLRCWLQERFDAAKEKANALSVPSQRLVRSLFEHDLDPIRAQILAELTRTEPQLRLVSPASVLAQLRVPLYLLHGAGDSVIPPSESLWLAHGAPARLVHSVLISKAVSHVELDGAPGLWDQWALVRFMAQVLDAAG